MGELGDNLQMSADEFDDFHMELYTCMVRDLKDSLHSKQDMLLLAAHQILLRITRHPFCQLPLSAADAYDAKHATKRHPICNTALWTM